MHVYVHIPFCRRKCIYCDFFSVGERLADWPGLVDSLLREARIRADSFGSHTPGVPSSLYIGGGTPSLMPVEELLRLSAGLSELFPDGPVEFTVEVNPDDVSEEKVAAWCAAGVNRVSMGVQSLMDTELKAICRRHTAVDAVKAYGLLRRSFRNISLDLIFGLPGQTSDSLRRTVDGFLDMAPEHISAYSLMYEERTALTRMRDRGTIGETAETDSVEMFAMVSDMLAGAGYEQYEISNYAREGFRSIHNSSYWKGLPYIGLGPGAHSYDGLRTRRANLPDLAAWRGGDETDFPFSEETLTDDELREEYIMTRLRTREGIPLDEFGRKFGSVERDRLLRKAGRFMEGTVRRNPQPLLTLCDDGKFLSLTRAGIMVSDEVISSLF